MIIRLLLSILIILQAGMFAKGQITKSTPSSLNQKQDTPFLVVLGTVQDAGSPHAGCTKKCCADLFDNPDSDRMVVSLGIVDPVSKQTWLFDATPDLSRQMKLLEQHAPFSQKETPDGIFLTHAHIGHYTGLMFLGRESMNSKEVPVYAMPRMKSFLENNGPWSQLVELKNIVIVPMNNQEQIQLSSTISVTAIEVPHRDEYSETVGFIIAGPTKKVLFIPDIDKWSKWKMDIIQEIKKVDYAFLDATFYDGEEVNNRDISEIPHPFVIESMGLFINLNASEKSKVYFIHLNHTNPILDINGEQTKTVIKNGFNIARIKQVFSL